IRSEDTPSWISGRIGDEKRLLGRTHELLERVLAAVGTQGQPADPPALIAVAKQLGLLYKQALDLGIRFASVRCDVLHDGVIRALSSAHDRFIAEFESFG